MYKNVAYCLAEMIKEEKIMDKYTICAHLNMPYVYLNIFGLPVLNTDKVTADLRLLRKKGIERIIQGEFDGWEKTFERYVWSDKRGEMVFFKDEEGLAKGKWVFIKKRMLNNPTAGIVLLYDRNSKIYSYPINEYELKLWTINMLINQYKGFETRLKRAAKTKAIEYKDYKNFLLRTDMRELLKLQLKYEGNEEFDNEDDLGDFMLL